MSIRTPFGKIKILDYDYESKNILRNAKLLNIEREDGSIVKMVGIAHTTTPHDIIYDTVQESLG